MFLKITFCGCAVKGKQQGGRKSGFLVVKKNVPIFGVNGLIWTGEGEAIDRGERGNLQFTQMKLIEL